MKILYTTARFPYPPLRGDQLIPYFRIRQLAKRHEITLLSFVETPEDKEHIDELKRYCAEVHTVPLPKWRSYANLTGGAFRSLPLQVLYYSSREYRRRLDLILARQNFDVLHTVLSRPARHTMDIKGPVKVCDMIDAISLTMMKRADAARGPSRWLWRMEAERMRRFERRVCESFDSVLVVSEVDRKELNAPNATVVPIGTDVSFRPRQSPNGHKTVILTGNFIYHSNEDAALFLMNQVWPQLRQIHPRMRLRIVGNGPSADLRNAAQRFPDVEITGFVPDLRQHLLEADVAVAPIRLAGGGTQCKALEAMACGTPVVLSRTVTGVLGTPGKDFLVAGEASEYVRAVREVLENPVLAKALSENGRQLVVENYSWEKTTQRLEFLYEGLLEQRKFGNHADSN